MSVHVPAPAVFFALSGRALHAVRDLALYVKQLHASDKCNWECLANNPQESYFTLLPKDKGFFYALPDTGTSFEQAVAALQKHFIPKVNVVVERHMFRKRAQLPHETVAQYITALRALYVKCDFKENADEMLRDQLLEHLLNKK